MNTLTIASLEWHTHDLGEVRWHLEDYTNYNSLGNFVKPLPCSDSGPAKRELVNWFMKRIRWKSLLKFKLWSSNFAQGSKNQQCFSEGEYFWLVFLVAFAAEIIFFNFVLFKVKSLNFFHFMMKLKFQDWDIFVALIQLVQSFLLWQNFNKNLGRGNFIWSHVFWVERQPMRFHLTSVGAEGDTN